MRGLLLPLAVGLFVYSPLAEDTLTLFEAQREAFQQGYETRAARMEQSSGRWQRNSAIGSYFPVVSLSTTYSRTETASPFFGNSDFPAGTVQPGTTPVLSGTLWSHQITLAQPITNGGSEIVAIILARNGLDALGFQSQAAGQDAILRVSTAYLNAIVAGERRLLDSVGIEWARRNLESAAIRHEAGVLPPTDILRWEAEVQDRIRQSLESHAAFAGAVRNVFLAMGRRDEGTDPESVCLQSVHFLEYLHQCDTSVETASPRNNPSFRAAQAGAAATRNRATLSLTGLLPRANGFISLGWPGQPDLIPEGPSFWSAGVRLEIPLLPRVGGYYDYLRNRSDWQRSQISAQQILHLLDAAVSGARERYAASHQAVIAARKSRELMFRALDIMEQRYQSGLANQIELLETRLSAERAHNGYVAALTQSLIRKTEYERSMGTLEAWQ